jgi:hypothetical protein
MHKGPLGTAPAQMFEWTPKVGVWRVFPTLKKRMLT